mmetsp:Transcript_101651/g.160748  ORF Transcript_101651/g.160748 Transcript_101651/m.160748 type:complete len:206 (-) Transcript_101651:867-1484(-)
MIPITSSSSSKLFTCTSPSFLMILSLFSGHILFSKLRTSLASTSSRVDGVDFLYGLAALFQSPLRLSLVSLGFPVFASRLQLGVLPPLRHISGEASSSSREAVQYPKFDLGASFEMTLRNCNMVRMEKPPFPRRRALTVLELVVFVSVLASATCVGLDSSTFDSTFFCSTSRMLISLIPPPGSKVAFFSRRPFVLGCSAAGCFAS